MKTLTGTEALEAFQKSQSTKGRAGISRAPLDARTAVLDGKEQVFGSTAEMQRYLFLHQLQKRGEIQNLQAQRQWSVDINGRHVCRYTSDCEYDHRGVHVVEDVKSIGSLRFSASQDRFALRKKLIEAFHQIEITVVVDVYAEPGPATYKKLRKPRVKKEAK